MQAITAKKMVMVMIVLLSLSLLIGCGGRMYAPKEGSAIWYYHPELPEADKAVEDARKAGKDKQCPAEFQAANDLKEEAYRTYWACRTDEAIAMAREATAKAKALCPAGPRAEMKPEAKPEPKPVPVSEPKPELKPALIPEPKPEPKVVEKVILLQDVHFDFDKANLTKVANSILASNIKTLKENPGVNVRIEGHTCAHGTEDFNMALGERRANAVKEYLVSQGIPADRMTTISYGETRLAMPEIPTPKNMKSAEAKANRRVHFEVIVK